MTRNRRDRSSDHTPACLNDSMCASALLKVQRPFQAGNQYIAGAGVIFIEHLHVHNPRPRRQIAGALRPPSEARPGAGGPGARVGRGAPRPGYLPGPVHPQGRGARDDRPGPPRGPAEDPFKEICPFFLFPISRRIKRSLLRRGRGLRAISFA